MATDHAVPPAVSVPDSVQGDVEVRAQAGNHSLATGSLG